MITIYELRKRVFSDDRSGVTRVPPDNVSAMLRRLWAVPAFPRRKRKVDVKKKTR